MLWGPQSILLPGGLCACHLVPTLCPRAPVPGVFRAGGLCQAAACCRRWKWFPDHREAKVRSPQHAARQEVASGQEQSPQAFPVPRPDLGAQHPVSSGTRSCRFEGTAAGREEVTLSFLPSLFSLLSSSLGPFFPFDLWFRFPMPSPVDSCMCLARG